MTVSRKTLTVAETLFQPGAQLELDVKSLEKSAHPVTLLETLSANKISINQSCGGHGTCGTCRVEILSGADMLKPPSEYEIEASQELSLPTSCRLSCQSELDLQSMEANLLIKIVNEVID